MNQCRIAIMLISIVVVLPWSAFACPVPVFRYAMERWAPDYYDAVLIHKGQIAEDDPAASLLQSETAKFLNLRLSRLDIASSTEDEVKSLLGPVSPETLPALAIWYPWQKGRAAPFWTGQLTSSTVAALVKSPKRQEIARRLIDGQSGVWILIESGNAEKDKAAMQLLDKELKAATEQLKESVPLGIDESAVPGLSYEFSILSVSRSDPKERFLLTMLLNSEPDLHEYTDEPIVFPVFGRGRALYALVGEGINTDNIQESIAFLTGPCGCEIKMLNPGVDLLMAENWDTAVMQFYEEFYEIETPQPELTSVFPEEPAETKLTTEDSKLKTQDKEIENALDSTASALNNKLTDANDKQTQTVEVKERKFRGLGVVGTTAVSLAAILLVVALGTVAMTRRRKEHP
jgi:hypothetical protein